MDTAWAQLRIWSERIKKIWCCLGFCQLWLLSPSLDIMFLPASSEVVFPVQPESPIPLNPRLPPSANGSSAYCQSVMTSRSGDITKSCYTRIKNCFWWRSGLLLSTTFCICSEALVKWSVWRAILTSGSCSWSYLVTTLE